MIDKADITAGTTKELMTRIDDLIERGYVMHKKPELVDTWYTPVWKAQMIKKKEE